LERANPSAIRQATGLRENASKFCGSERDRRFGPMLPAAAVKAPGQQYLSK
jgi:hypothetical protein